MIEIIGWKKGFKTISFTKLLMENTSLGLIASKSFTEKILNGEKMTVVVEDENIVAKKMKDLGAEVIIC
jgi:ribosomal protein L7/L12